MVNRSNNAVYFCDNFWKLCGSIHRWKWMFCNICDHSGNSKFSTSNADNNSEWSNHVLCGRFCGFDFVFGDRQRLVELTDDTNNHCNNIRIVLCDSHRRERMSSNVCTNGCNGKCSTGNADNHSEWSNDILCGRFGDIDIFASDR